MHFGVPVVVVACVWVLMGVVISFFTIKGNAKNFFVCSRWAHTGACGACMMVQRGAACTVVRDSRSAEDRCRGGRRGGSMHGATNGGR